MIKSITRIGNRRNGNCIVLEIISCPWIGSWNNGTDFNSSRIGRRNGKGQCNNISQAEFRFNKVFHLHSPRIGKSHHRTDIRIPGRYIASPLGKMIYHIGCHRIFIGEHDIIHVCRLVNRIHQITITINEVPFISRIF